MVPAALIRRLPNYRRKPGALAYNQLPVIPERPGFRGFYFLRDAGPDKLMTISLWETREDLQASVARAAGQAGLAAAFTEQRVDTYEVTLSA